MDAMSCKGYIPIWPWLTFRWFACKSINKNLDLTTVMLKNRGFILRLCWKSLRGRCFETRKKAEKNEGWVNSPLKKRRADFASCGRPFFCLHSRWERIVLKGTDKTWFFLLLRKKSWKIVKNGWAWESCSQARFTFGQSWKAFSALGSVPFYSPPLLILPSWREPFSLVTRSSACVFPSVTPYPGAFFASNREKSWKAVHLLPCIG